MRLTSLGSGSSGNAFLLQSHEATVLLDCGVGVRAINKALSVCGPLSAVVVSHEHGDHVRSLSSVLSKHACEVVASAGTFGAIGTPEGARLMRAGERFQIDSLTISFVGVSHDAAEPCGFFIESPETSIAVITDLGCVEPQTLEAISAADSIVLESNYDETMLSCGRYPAHLKRRIRSAVGHLSNEDCAAALAHSARSTVSGIWLSHLSDKNNVPQIAVATSREALLAAGKDIPVTALPRFEPMTILPFTPPPRQANLFDF